MPPNLLPPHNADHHIITHTLIAQIEPRLVEAREKLGEEPVQQAHKGLSRVLTPTHEDLDRFATELQEQSRTAIDSNWHHIANDVPCFALSYQHCENPVGRFKFSSQQWSRMHTLVNVLAQANVPAFRVWLDQCLWIRDASQASWAHTGVLPYAIWPVIALDTKQANGERTVNSFSRMWLFVEQLTALWGLGLIILSEYRKSAVRGERTWLTKNLRTTKTVDQTLLILLLNVFHGAVDSLDTVWEDDKRELVDMARANLLHETEQIVIGSNWKERLGTSRPLSDKDVAMKVTTWGGAWLDGSRKVDWNCMMFAPSAYGWLSGARMPQSSSSLLFRHPPRYALHSSKERILLAILEFLFMTSADVETFVWVYPSRLTRPLSFFSILIRGRYLNPENCSSLLFCNTIEGDTKDMVATLSKGDFFLSFLLKTKTQWTKVMTGRKSRNMRVMARNKNKMGIQEALRDEIRNDGFPSSEIDDLTDIQIETICEVFQSDLRSMYTR